MVHALLLAEEELQSRRARFRSGHAPSELPYGIEALEGVGYELSGVRRSDSRLIAKARDVVEHRVGFPVERAIRGTVRATRADLVIALLEHQASLVGSWKRLVLPPYARVPLVIWSCWLADDLRKGDRESRRRLLRRYGSADLITHMSRHETEIFLDSGFDESRLATLDFGINQDYYTPGNGPRDIQVLSVGQDRGRDFATLIEAVRGTDLHLDVVCKPHNVAGIDIPANVRVHAPVSLPDYRALLRRAQVVAVPTHELAYPTGQSVALEASATGACVVVTGTRAMGDYFVDGINARLVGVGDVLAWREVLIELVGDEQQRGGLGDGALRSVRERFNSDQMWTQFDALLHKLGVVSGI